MKNWKEEIRGGLRAGNTDAEVFEYYNDIRPFGRRIKFGTKPMKTRELEVLHRYIQMCNPDYSVTVKRWNDIGLLNYKLANQYCVYYRHKVS
jgi:hypothetical protein